MTPRSSPRISKLQTPPGRSPRNQLHNPSTQVELDLERTYNTVRLRDQETQKLYVYHRKAVQDELDAKEYAQAVVHKAGIDDALAKQEIVRQQAVAVLEAHIREEENRRRREEDDKRRREAEERQRAEEARKLREENERKARKAREKAEAEKKAAEARIKAEQEEKERKRREDIARKQQEAKDKIDADAAAAEKQREDDARATAEQEAVAKVAATEAAKNAGSAPSLPWSSAPEIRHKHYLDIHQRLKTFRKSFTESVKTNPALKPFVGEMRRDLRTAAGQPSIFDKEANNKATNKVIRILTRAKDEISSPAVVLNDYLPPHLNLLDKNTTTVPALFLYLMNMLSKALIKSFVGIADKHQEADPFGTLAVKVFSEPSFQYQRNVPSANSGLHYDRFGGNEPTPPMSPTSVSLISILLAKFHADAPILFGVSGSETTEQGRARIRWKKVDNTWIPPQQHYNRMVSLAAGYASISLRNFSKLRARNNPYPPIHFWETLSAIINTPGNQVQISHVLLLKTLVDAGYERFILFFGADAIVALRQATVAFPKTFPKELAARAEARALVILPDTWARDMKVHLT